MLNFVYLLVPSFVSIVVVNAYYVNGFPKFTEQYVIIIESSSIRFNLQAPIRVITFYNFNSAETSIMSEHNSV